MKTQNEFKDGQVSEPKKNRRWMVHVLYLAILIAILLLWKCCSDKKEKEYDSTLISLSKKADSLTNENGALKIKINELENRKAVLVSRDTTENHLSGRFVKAIIVPKEDSRNSSMFMKDIVKKVRVEVPVLVECPPVPKCPDITPLVDSLNKANAFLDYSIDICMDKYYRTDSARILLHKNLPVRELFSEKHTSIQYNHSFIEYLPNEYRKKSENAFWRGVVSGAISIGTYAWSESLGHPTFFDDRDNSAAQTLHNQIFTLRTISTVSALYSAFQFQRAWHFHNMEGKYIVSPTGIGLSIDLYSK